MSEGIQQTVKANFTLLKKLISEAISSPRLRWRIAGTVRPLQKQSRKKAHRRNLCTAVWRRDNQQADQSRLGLDWRTVLSLPWVCSLIDKPTKLGNVGAGKWERADSDQDWKDLLSATVVQMSLYWSEPQVSARKCKHIKVGQPLSRYWSVIC